VGRAAQQHDIDANQKNGGAKLPPGDLALVGAKIYPSPADPAIENGSILVHDGRIAAVGPTSTVKIPKGATVIDCKGLVVTAGFWNSHVHILTLGLLHADKLSSEQIGAQLEEMLTRWGFTTVFDIASVLENTNLIRRRIEVERDRCADLHLWRLGPGHAGVVLSVVSDDPQPPDAYKARLEGLAGLSHVTVEVHRCPH